MEPAGLSPAGHPDLWLVIRRPNTPKSFGADTGNRPLGLSLYSLRVTGAETDGACPPP